MCIRDSHTTLDTSGNPYTTKVPWHSKWLELMKYTDLLLLDIKQINEQEHVKLTGQTNTNILAMARELSDMGLSLIHIYTGYDLYRNRSWR